jgi:multidrug efflux system membrane fusion protein
MLSRLRKYGSWFLAFFFALAAVLWIASGEFGGRNEPDARKEPAHLAARQQVPQVRVRTQTVQQHTQTLAVQARTKAEKKVTVAAETTGRVVELLVDKGDTVEKGELLARIDAQDKPARLAEARARLDQRRIELEAARQLSEKGYRAQNQLAEARAYYEEAMAAVSKADIALADTKVRAPFAGQVGDRMVEVGDYLTDGAPILRLVDLDPIEVVADVSERDIGMLHIGDRATAELITGERIEGRISYIASEADEDTRTFGVEMTAPNPDRRARDGVTASLRVAVRQAPAHLLAPSILTLTDQGMVGVKYLDEGDRVRFQEVDILSDTREGIWVTGLPDEVTLITVGQNFVNVGQEVEPVEESDVVNSLEGTPLDMPEDAPGKPGPESRP